MLETSVPHRFSTSHLESSHAPTRPSTRHRWLPLLLTVLALALTSVIGTSQTAYGQGPAQPEATQFVLGISDLLREQTLLLGLGAIGVILGVRTILSTDGGKRLRDTVAIRAPLFGGLVRGAITAQVCRTLGTLLTNGVALVTALDIQRQSASNVHVRASLDAMIESVRRGDALTRGMEQSDVFPEMVVRMIQAGEKTAELDTMLLRAAEHYEDNVDAVTDTLSAILEPLLIVFIGAIIGGILVAIYLPMFNMINVVQ